jgi:hypothetical protein
MKTTSEKREREVNKINKLNYMKTDFVYICRDSRDSADGIATGYGLTTEGFEFKSRCGQEFSPLHVVHTGSGAHPASYPMGNWGSFLGG